MKLPELKKKFKNKYAIRIIAGALVVTLVGTGVSVYDVSAAKGNGTAAVTIEEKVDAKATDTEDKLDDMLSGKLTINEKEIGKEETVYIIADNTGKADSVIVSDHLINNDDKAAIEDASTLTDIKNVKGDETFTQNGNKLVWQADGNDIYYQGTGKEETPISQKITYALDGKEITPEELAGKSGKVTIRFDYTNNEKREATVNGKKEEVCVPFVALSGMVLDNSFSDIEVTNGRVVADGNKNVVFGYALPGLKDSLKVDEDDFDADVTIPDYFEVTANVEEFSLDMTMTVAMNATNFISAENDSDTSSVDELFDKLTDATSQLEDGSAALADGVDTLKSNMGEFKDGVGTLREGLEKYTDGAATLHDGIGTLKGGVDTLAGSVPTLVDGVKQLKAGSDTAAAKAPELAGGAKQVAKGASDLSTGAAALAKGSTDLAAGVGQLAAKAPELAEGANQLAAQVPELAKGAKQLETGVNELVGTVQGMGTMVATGQQTAYDIFLKDSGIPYELADVFEEGLKKAQEGLIRGISTELKGEDASDTYAQVIAGLADLQMNVSINGMAEALNVLNDVNVSLAKLEKGIGQVKGTVDVLNMVGGSFTTEKMQQLEFLKTGAGQLAAETDLLAKKAPELAGGATQLSDGIGQLNAKVPELAGGAKQVSDGATALSTGAKQVSDGAAQLSDGIGALNAGITQMHDKSGALSEGAGALKDGVNKLAQGSSELVSNNGQLKDGVNKLNDGTDKIVDGVGQLSDGAHELADGIVTFNEEGITKIVNSYNGDLQPLMDRLQAVLDAGEEYQSYTDIADGVNGSVKFIYKTAAVKAE